MTERTTSQSVLFAYTFLLPGVEGRQPAGTYLVETTEECLDTMLLPAFRRKSTVIHLPPGPDSPGTTRIVSIEPDELERALGKDRRQQTWAENSRPEGPNP
jgi:hypothetical protein